MTSSIRLPETIEHRLDQLSQLTGRTKSFYVKEAIVEHIDDLEDSYLAEQRYADVISGKTKTTALIDVIAKLDPVADLGFLDSLSPAVIEAVSETTRLLEITVNHGPFTDIERLKVSILLLQKMDQVTDESSNDQVKQLKSILDKTITSQQNTQPTMK